MDIKLPWIIDPSTKLPSVSLSLLVLTFIGVITTNVLMLTKQIESSAFTEIFYACAGLYFGRKLSFSNGTKTLDKTTEKTTTVEQEQTNV